MTTIDFIEAVRAQCGADAASFAHRHLYEPVSYAVDESGTITVVD